MPWWEQRMWVEQLNEDFARQADGEESGSVEQDDDLSGLGITPNTIQ